MKASDNNHGRAYGPVMMVMACLCFSLGGLLCKLIPWSPLAINGCRNIFSTVVIGLYLLIKRHKLRFNRTVLFGAVCMYGVTTLFIMANKMTTSANAIILQYTAPIWIIMFMFLFFRKKPAKQEIITLIVVFAGILCFFFDSISGGSVLGDLTAVTSGAFYAGVFIINQFRDGDTFSALFFGQLATAVTLGPLVRFETDFSLPVLAAMAVLGIVQVGIAYVFFGEGTMHTKPVTASLIAVIEPILNPLLVAVFMHEMIKHLSLLGAAVVITAILIYNIRDALSPRQ